MERERTSPQDAPREGISVTPTAHGHREPWRTEPEIGLARQEQLARCLATVPDSVHGIYPFKGIKLSRADVEWLLATHRKEHPEPRGLDLRGADLRYTDLHALPLARLRGSLTHQEWDDATREQRAAAAILLTGADLSEAHLEEAELVGTSLEKVSLHEAHLEKADLARAHLERAFLARTRLQETDLSETHLEKADLSEGYLQDAALRWSHLEHAYLGSAHLEKADLGGARLDKGYLSEAHLEEADLSEAHLEESYLSGAHLQRANLSGAHLEGAYLNEANLNETLLYKAHLERTFLYKAHLEGARLSQTRVEERHLKKALESGEQHIGPSLADAQWGHVNLAVVQWSQVDMLGDEDEARQSTRAGKKKSNATRLEEYEAAVRANRQLAVALRAQGLDELAARFAYRAQLLQRMVLWRQGKLGSYLFSLCLDLLAGYGYRPGRSLIAYLVVILVFMGLYLLSAHGGAVHLSWDEALVLSVSSFHGRGFFLPNIALGDAFARLAAVEAVLGLLIEISFIATFTQRFFGR
ncbi:MAG TPA: pentapeptide repeat-containing protein [Ktedonobacteraceae bacterium]|nr:pentapeptide repeat-containing protein [Ktedonobacteraceae bacterium]